MLEKLFDLSQKIFALCFIYTGIVTKRSWMLFFAVLMFAFCLAGDYIKELRK